MIKDFFMKNSNSHATSLTKTTYSLCLQFFIKLFFNQMIALQNLWKVFFISSKKLSSFSRYSNFSNLFSSFPHFPDTEGQIEVE